ncbi:MAG: hypothetical protein M4579_005315 [Chaenotheca gracillima]|nr:MAG: hypothetical protein M4579_005315 [Chaenotheca gracillima]
MTSQPPPQPPPPPPPPPHGSTTSSGLPKQGKYDIFIIPPHSAGGGFLYLPSFQTNRNSFLLGVACTTVFWLVGQIVAPVLKEWFASMVATGGSGVVMLILGVGVAGWAWGKTQTEGSMPWHGGGGGSNQDQAGGPHTAQPNAAPPPGSGPNVGGASAGAAPKPTWQRANTGPAGTGNFGGGTARGAWERARDETRKKEEERKKKEDDLKKAKDAVAERAKAREKEAKERDEREKKQKDDKARRETATATAGARNAARGNPSSPGKHRQPTARTYLGTEDDEYSYRPYDEPKRRHQKDNSHSSARSESSYAASHSTSRTTPPPSHRGAYATKDPDKIVIKAVYSFSNAFTKLPAAQLVSGTGSVTDGLILRITTEGLFIDDDVRSVPQREWDVKAWTMKLVESGDFKGLHVLRATIRDQDGRRYVFVLEETESWKVAVGLQRLRRGTQVRALGVSGLSIAESRTVLEGLGWSR